LGIIHKNYPPIKKNKQKNFYSRSYKNNNSRIKQITPKHSSFKLNLIATIALDIQNPVPYFEINEESTNGSIFANYIGKRTLPDHIRYDIIDRHSTHKSNKANIERGDPSVIDVYVEESIKPDFCPAAMPQYNPVECLFSFINKELEDISINNKIRNGWKIDEMKESINDAIGKVTFKMVQGWYERTYKELYPNRKIPVFLRSDISKKKFQSEVDRAKKKFNSRKITETKTRSGRTIKKTNLN
jgi:hypothetical protein